MVTLTNQTTNTASVSQNAVSVPATDNEERIINRTFGFSTENQTNSSSGEDWIRGCIVDVDVDCTLTSFNAFIDPFGTITGSAKAAIYRKSGNQATYVESSDEYTFTSFAGLARWHEFTFPEGVELVRGSYALVVWSDVDLRVEQTEDLGVESIQEIRVNTTYTGTFPTTITVANDSAAVEVPQIYITTTAHQYLVDSDSPLVEFGNRGIEVSNSSDPLDGRAAGQGFDSFPGGIIYKVGGFFVPSSTPTGRFKMAVYLDGEFIAETSDQFFEDAPTNSFEAEFDIGPVSVNPGQVTIVAVAEGSMNLRAESLLTSGAILASVTTDLPYESGFPASIATRRVTTNYRQVYIKYVSSLLAASTDLSITWNQSDDSWDSATHTWESIQTSTSLSNS